MHATRANGEREHMLRLFRAELHRLESFASARARRSLASAVLAALPDDSAA